MIRIVDLESSYEVARHYGTASSTIPPTTSEFCAPEVQKQAPDGRPMCSRWARFSTPLIGYGWTWESQLWDASTADTEIDADLRTILQTALRPDAGQAVSIDRGDAAALAAYLESIWPGRSWA